MLEDKEEIVRESVIKALSLLIVLCTDSNKYHQCEQIVLSTLNDSNNTIVNFSTQVLFPVLGKWSLKEGNFDEIKMKMNEIDLFSFRLFEFKPFKAFTEQI